MKKAALTAAFATRYGSLGSDIGVALAERRILVVIGGADLFALARQQGGLCLFGGGRFRGGLGGVFGGFDLRQLGLKLGQRCAKLAQRVADLGLFFVGLDRKSTRLNSSHRT